MRAAVSRGPQHWQHMFGESFVMLWGFKWLGKRSVVESVGLALSPQAVSEFSKKQACGNAYGVSRYSLVLKLVKVLM